MSVTFSISGVRPNFDADACPACVDGDWQSCVACGGTGFSDAYRAGVHTAPNYVNVAEDHAVELLRWLGYEVDPQDLCGLLPPADLRRRCLRRLADTPANVAGDLPRAAIRRGNFILAGRDAGYLRRRTQELLALAERADDRMVEYS